MNSAEHSVVSSAAFVSTTFPSPAPQLRQDLQPETGGGSARIRALVVDDDLLAREFLCRLLRKEPGVEVVGTAASGLQALEAIHRLRPDLVFLDVQMPELDG